MKKLFCLPTTNPGLVYFTPPRLNARRRRFVRAILAMVLTVGLTTVRADEMYLSVSSGFTNGVALLPQFDPALGTLTYVHFGVGGHLDFWLNITNLTGNDFVGCYGDAVGIQVSISGTSLTAEGGQVDRIYGNVPAYSSITQFVDYGMNGAWLNFYRGNLDLLTGTGYVTVPEPTVLMSFNCDPALLSITASSINFSDASTFLGYGYEPAPVPEPSTFTLVGLGAAALAILRRRK